MCVSGREADSANVTRLTGTHSSDNCAIPPSVSPVSHLNQLLHLSRSRLLFHLSSLFCVCPFFKFLLPFATFCLPFSFFLSLFPSYAATHRRRWIIQTVLHCRFSPFMPSCLPFLFFPSLLCIIPPLPSCPYKIHLTGSSLITVLIFYFYLNRVWVGAKKERRPQCLVFCSLCYRGFLALHTHGALPLPLLISTHTSISITPSQAPPLICNQMMHRSRVCQKEWVTAWTVSLEQKYGLATRKPAGFQEAVWLFHNHLDTSPALQEKWAKTLRLLKDKRLILLCRHNQLLCDFHLTMVDLLDEPSLIQIRGILRDVKRKPDLLLKLRLLRLLTAFYGKTRWSRCFKTRCAYVWVTVQKWQQNSDVNLATGSRQSPSCQKRWQKGGPGWGGRGEELPVKTK